MLNIKLLREDLERTAAKLETRGCRLDIETLEQLEAKRKAIQLETQSLQNQRNQHAKAIGQAKASGVNIEPLLADVNHLGETLKAAEAELAAVQAALHDIYITLPNLPHASVPQGTTEEDNVEVRRWGAPRAFDFEVQDHVALGGANLDLVSASRLSGARFVVLQSHIAKLHRALGQFMLDYHVKHHGYTELYVPYLVSHECLYGTGQLPKMADDLFSIANSGLALIPTSEVSITNIARDQIIDEHLLPLKYVCHSPCFRKEAGSYGKDMRGMLRQHQFDKVEMVQLVMPEDSYSALEAMVGHAEAILQALQLPYRVMCLNTSDLGFNAAKTYDLEVWLPGQDRYREISSCSNTESFQARRMQARFRSRDSHKPEYLHTLNGSGVAVGRALIAVMENYQDAAGRIRIPEVLLPYMGGIDIIESEVTIQ